MDLNALAEREAQILAAMPVANLTEQGKLMADLNEVRALKAAHLASAREVDLANAIVIDHLAPVAAFQFGASRDTDWIASLETSAALDEDGDQAMAVEASLWFDRVDPAVRADQDEFAIQARGMAKVLASAYDAAAPAAEATFLSHVEHLSGIRVAESNDEKGSTDEGADPAGAGTSGLDHERSPSDNPEQFAADEPEVHPMNESAHAEAEGDGSTDIVRTQGRLRVTAAPNPAYGAWGFTKMELASNDRDMQFFFDRMNAAARDRGIDPGRESDALDASRDVILSDAIHGAGYDWEIVGDTIRVWPQGVSIHWASRRHATSSNRQEADEAMRRAQDGKFKSKGSQYTAANVVGSSFSDLGDKLRAMGLEVRSVDHDVEGGLPVGGGEGYRLIEMKVNDGHWHQERVQLVPSTSQWVVNVPSWVTSARTAAEGDTCSVCGDKIARDPGNEEPQTWHHDNGEKHDHEAKPAKEGRRTAATCSCAHNNDGSVTTMLCPLHAAEDPCWTTARVTGRRRSGSIVNGVCSSCGWSASGSRESRRRQAEVLVTDKGTWDKNDGEVPSESGAAETTLEQVEVSNSKETFDDPEFPEEKVSRRTAGFLSLDDIPPDHEVQPIAEGGFNTPLLVEARDPATCGACGLTWDDGISTGITPVPGGRCPFEYFHDDPDDDDHYASRRRRRPIRRRALEEGRGTEELEPGDIASDSGAAESTLPLSVEPTDNPETFDEAIFDEEKVAAFRERIRANLRRSQETGRLTVADQRHLLPTRGRRPFGERAAERTAARAVPAGINRHGDTYWQVEDDGGGVIGYVAPYPQDGRHGGRFSVDSGNGYWLGEVGSLDEGVQKLVEHDAWIDQRMSNARVRGARSDYDHHNEDADHMWWQEEGRHEEEPPDPDDFYDDFHEAARRQGAADFVIPSNAGARDFFADQTLAQIGNGNVLAISGGRVNPITVPGPGGHPRTVGISLPVAQGYAVNIFLANDDTYIVQRVFRGQVKAEMTNVYAEEIGEVAYRAGMYHDDFPHTGAQKVSPEFLEQVQDRSRRNLNRLTEQDEEEERKRREQEGGTRTASEAWDDDEGTCSKCGAYVTQGSDGQWLDASGAGCPSGGAHDGSGPKERTPSMGAQRTAERNHQAECIHCGGAIDRGAGVGERAWRHAHSGEIECDSGESVADPKHRMARRTAMPNPVDLGVAVGDIFYASWGYDQTNVNFYEVVGLTGASVKIRPIHGAPAGTGDSVVPAPGSYHDRDVLLGMGKAEGTKRIQGGYQGAPGFSIGSSAWASKWDGTPIYKTPSGMGH
jgi:hypothetical protein